MFRPLALAAIASLATVAVAGADTVPSKHARHKQTVSAPAPDPKADATPDPVTWMGHAIDDILTTKLPGVDDDPPARK